MATYEHEGQIRTSDGLMMLTGVWLIVAPALIGFGSTGLKWSSVVTGIVVALLGASHEASLRMTWQSWVSMLAGLWAIIAPFTFSSATTGATWASVIGGILAIAFAAWNVEAVTTDPVLHHTS